MKKSKLALIALLIISFLSNCSKSIYNLNQSNVPEGINNVVYLGAKKIKLNAYEKDNWQHLELAKDTIPGMNMKKAYRFLKTKKAKSIIVAVIDSGQDIDHEDLKNNIWTNHDEIADNGIDDDKNGFIDDIHGWNFLGNTLDENLEITRMVKMYQDKYKGKSIENLEGSEQLEYKKYKELEDIVSEKYEKSNSVYYNLDFHKSASSLTAKAYNYNLKIYGDNNIRHKESHESHGTHVAGIIAGNRLNDIGLKGVSDKTKIMSVRVVPNGDEYDKDVAMGIRYAVDNGAKVINMSFGKAYSPNKEWVGEAFKYAAKHDVLILHSSGNNGADIDVEHTYPNDAPNYKKEWSDNVLTIGALNPVYGKKLVASFSNYGSESVDIFAPGVQIYSTVPDDKYAYFSGTSMATPAVAGLAALIRTYYPRLSASQVKHIIMNSGTKINMEVNVPGKKDVLLPYSELCVSGRIVNGYSALVMADQMSNTK